jgi:Regulators of stationary/sporulation gene expression
MSRQQRALMPRDAYALKTYFLTMAEKALQNMERYRDREQVHQLITSLKERGVLPGVGVRRIRSTGVTRKLDQLGRFVIPSELRREFGIVANQPADIYIEGEWIVIEPSKDYCVICKSEKDLNPFKGKYICETCVGDLFSD